MYDRSSKQNFTNVTTPHLTIQGIQCFAFDEEAHILVTGGPDCTVRVWNPFVPTKPNVIFQGHHAGVTSIVLQNGGQTVYSLSRDRVIKVWDVQSQQCVQVRSYLSRCWAWRDGTGGCDGQWRCTKSNVYRYLLL